MLRMPTQTSRPKDISRLHSSRHTERAYSLYCLGKVLFVRVSSAVPTIGCKTLEADINRKLYGEDDEVGDDDELNKAQADGENGELMHRHPDQAPL